MTKKQKFTWKEISHRFKLHRSYSISFNLSKVGEIFWVKSEKTESKFRKNENENFCVVFTNSMKWARETRKFHVAVMQRWLKSVMHVQSCRFAYEFFAFSLPSPSSLLKFRIVMIQTFCYHGNVTSHFIVFSFSWGHFNSRGKLKTMFMQNFGVTIKEYYGLLWYFL